MLDKIADWREPCGREEAIRVNERERESNSKKSLQFISPKGKYFIHVFTCGHWYAIPKNSPLSVNDFFSDLGQKKKINKKMKEVM